MKYVIIMIVLIVSLGCSDQESNKPPQNSTPDISTESVQPTQKHPPTSELTQHSVKISIPDGWDIPFAAMGAQAPQFQDGDRTVSPMVHEVYLSPKHGEDWAELEIVLYDIDARSWLNAMVFQPTKWLPVQGDKLLPWPDADGREIIGSLIPFGNATAVKFRLSRTLRGLGGNKIDFVEDLYYCSCGDKLLRIQMRCAPSHFPMYESSLFTDFQKLFKCSRPRD